MFHRASLKSQPAYLTLVIQAVGLDGFWLGRMLSKEPWIESHIVEAASIAMPRRHRRAKTDRIDGETLIRALMARGNAVCSQSVPRLAGKMRLAGLIGGGGLCHVSSAHECLSCLWIHLTTRFLARGGLLFIMLAP